MPPAGTPFRSDSRVCVPERSRPGPVSHSSSRSGSPGPRIRGSDGRRWLSRSPAGGTVPDNNGQGDIIRLGRVANELGNVRQDGIANAFGRLSQVGSYACQQPLLTINRRLFILCLCDAIGVEHQNGTGGNLAKSPLPPRQSGRPRRLPGKHAGAEPDHPGAGGGRAVTAYTWTDAGQIGGRPATRTSGPPGNRYCLTISPHAVAGRKGCADEADQPTRQS